MKTPTFEDEVIAAFSELPNAKPIRVRKRKADASPRPVWYRCSVILSGFHSRDTDMVVHRVDVPRGADPQNQHRILFP